jgi:hypothetical protein
MATRRKQIEGVPETLLRFVPSEWPAEHACYSEQALPDGIVYRHGEDCGFFPRFCQYHEARMAHEGLNSLDVIKEDHRRDEWKQEGTLIEELYVDGEPYVPLDAITWVPAEGEGEPVLMGCQTPRILVMP